MFHFQMNLSQDMLLHLYPNHLQACGSICSIY
jgi:hypothetical protein